MTAKQAAARAKKRAAAGAFAKMCSSEDDTLQLHGDMLCDAAWFPDGADDDCDDAGVLICEACGCAFCECDDAEAVGSVEANLAKLDAPGFDFAAFAKEEGMFEPAVFAAYTGERQRAVAEQGVGRDKDSARQRNKRKRDKAAGNAAAATGCKSMRSYFEPKRADAAVAGAALADDCDLGCDSGSDVEDAAVEDALRAKQDYAQVQVLLAEAITAAKDRGDARDHLAHLAVARYHGYVAGSNPQPRLTASRVVASVLYYSSKSHGGKERTCKCRAEKIRRDLKHFLRHKSLPQDRRGLGRQNPSRIFDPAFEAMCRSVIANDQSEWGKDWSAAQFRDALMREMHADGSLEQGKTISKKAACFYLRYMGMTLICTKKGIYKDGHERADVVEHRQKTHCKRVKDLLPRMRKVEAPASCSGKLDCACAGKGCVELSQIAANAGSEVVPVYHDEVICAANEGRTSHWGQKGDRFHLKTKGSSIMLSGLICPCHGRMEITGDDVPKFEAFCRRKHPRVAFAKSKFKEGGGGYHSFTSIEPGKNKDGWWTGRDVVDQMEEIVPIFEFTHPGKVALFVFDNSTNHSVHPPGALVVGPGVNFNPGGKNAPGAWTEDPKKIEGASKKHPKQIPPMRDGWHHDEDGVKVVDKMHLDLEPHRFRGTKDILMGRRLFDWRNPLRAECHRSADEVPDDGHCCCKHLLAAQPDFKAQATALEELITELGHMHLMLPKCHPELNPIEQFWAAVKECLRRNCLYTLPGLKKNLPAAIRCVPLAQVQRYCRRADRFVDMCTREAELGVALPGAVRAFAMKRCKRHRTVPATLLDDLASDLEAKQVLLGQRLQAGKGKKAAVQAKLARVEGMLGALAEAKGGE